MSFRKYAKYRPSGVEGLGDVPAHWKIVPLKRGYKVTLGKMLQPAAKGPGDEQLPYLRAANIKWSGVDTSDMKTMWFSPAERSVLELHHGDLLVSEGGDVGRACLWRSEVNPCAFQNSVNRVRAIGDNSTNFLLQWIRTLKERGYIDVLCNRSTIAHLTAEKVAEIPVALPPAAEQRAIAAFLEGETAKIDALVAEQERLIELLKEKRQVAFSHAVTKGLNPDVSMRDSGVECLGKIPAHWKVRRLKDVTELIVDCPHETPQYSEDGEYSVIRTADLEHGLLVPDEMYRVAADEYRDRIRRESLKANDIVYGREGERWGHAALAGC